MADSPQAICNLALLKIGANGSLLTGPLGTDNSAESDACSVLYPAKRDELLRAFRWNWATKRAYLSPLGGAAWSAAAPYAQGAYVTFQPGLNNVANPPETLSTFVYYALQAVAPGGATPDLNPTQWRQLSRAPWAYAFSVPPDLLEAQSLYHGARNPREDQKVPFAIEYESSVDANGNSVGPGKILLTDEALPWEAAYLGPNANTTLELVYTAQVTDPRQYPPDFTEALAWAIAKELALAVRKDAGQAKAAGEEAAAAMAVAKAAALREQQRDQPATPSHIAARSSGRRGANPWGRR